MSFISYAFLGIYLLAMVLRWMPSGPTGSLPWGKVLALMLLSWTFYAWHEPWFILLILFSTAVDYYAGLALAHSPDNRVGTRRAVLLASLLTNLGLLGYFKYAMFFTSSANSLLATPFSVTQILLPVGISFYTFQSMSYTIDVYRGEIKAEKSFLRFASYIAFCPQLVAGPIVRASHFLYQFRRRRRLHRGLFLEGCYLILRGLFLKMVVADNLGRIVDQYWGQAANEGEGVLALSLLVFFACQLLCDFAGYVDIARGVAYHLGFRLPVNFNAPYLASTFSGFWRRWHITLSEWLRDYLYKPLGGSRQGVPRNFFNLLLVMLISGLWHGAAWTFVAWGGMLGLALALESLLHVRQWQRSPLVIFIGFLLVQLTWLMSMGMFRADGLEQGLIIMQHALLGLWQVLLGLEQSELPLLLQFGWWLTFPVFLWHLRALLSEQTKLGPVANIEKTAYAGMMLPAVLMMYTTGQSFIYFQF